MHPKYSCDVLVIGGGYAGLTAAIFAAQDGDKVILLEKTSSLGGNSVMSDGCLAGTGLPEQEASGIKDSPELMAADILAASKGLADPALVGVLAENSARAVAWSKELGVVYDPEPVRYGGHSVPRALNQARLSGGPLLKALKAEALTCGVEIITKACLRQINREEQGRVTGAMIELKHHRDHFRPEYTVCYRSDSVILACGGYAADVAFRQKHYPALHEGIASTNKPTATAEGLIAAMDIGAEAVHLSHIQLAPWTSPQEAMFGTAPMFSLYVAMPLGLMIDPATGKRFANEMAGRKPKSEAILSLGHPCLAIADAGAVERAGYDISAPLKRGVLKAYSSLKELAAQHQVDPEALAETMAEFNQMVEQGCDPNFGREFGPLAEPLTAPFYCAKLWPKAHYTSGGVRIDSSARVLDRDGHPIPGLYAAGEMTGGVHGADRLNSCAITDCLVFGRIAGHSAAHRL